MLQRLYFLFLLPFVFLLVSCGSEQSPGTDTGPDPEPTAISDDSLLTLTQRRTFQYFWDGAEPNSGMARERYIMSGDYPQNDKNVVTTGGLGFGIMAIIVGMDRGFISQPEGVQRLEKIVGFLESADRF
ncbi:MAG TPA: hypothetical protein VK074_05155, partial [Fodinibius sp.]|nr:hypothetical protein [Fodinibius sp.]